MKSIKLITLFATTILLSSIVVAKDKKQDKSFLLMGDMHYDLVENHDMDWVNENGFYDQIVNSYSKNTAKYFQKFVTTLRKQSERKDMIAQVQLGDMSEGLAGSEEKVRKMDLNLFRIVDSIGFKNPFVMVKGNHDITGPGAREAFKEIYAPNIRRVAQIDDSTTNGHYTKRIGDVLYAAYDCFEKECTPQWLDSVLANSDARYKFVVIHEPIIPINYQCRHLYRRAKDAQRRQDLLKAVASNKAIVLNGHIHQYAVLRRDTEWGPIVQVSVSSVIYDDTHDTPRNLTTDFNPDMVDLYPNWHGDQIEERRQMLKEEAPFIKSYKWADMPGYAIITMRGDDGHVILNYYPNYKTTPVDTVDITDLYSLN